MDAEQLRFQRLRKGLTLEIVASRMGFSPQYLCDLEKGRREWDAELLAKFEKALKI